MILLALDPSTSAIGYCVCEAVPWRHIEAGIIRPDHARDDAITRARSMSSDIVNVANECQPTDAIVEIPSPNAAKAARGYAGTGAATYGVGVGYALAVLDEWFGSRRPGSDAVRTIGANIWKRREKKDALRRRLIAEFPQFRNELVSDRGGDMADAIELSRWFCAHERATNCVTLEKVT